MAGFGWLLFPLVLYRVQCSLGATQFLQSPDSRDKLLCTVDCQNNPKCASLLLQTHPHPDRGGSWEDCILVLVESEFPPQMFHVPNGFNQWQLLRVSPSVVLSQVIDPEPLLTQASAMGFNLSLRVGDGTVFLKRIQDALAPGDAERKCFSEGGILPMEDSEEFIKAMSKLIGDASSPRLVSLVRDTMPDGVERHLVWTLGKKEYQEGQEDHPKFVDWSNSNLDFRYFMVKPNSMTYEAIAETQTMTNVHCQFLGHNLATGKNGLASSFQSNRPVDLALDGLLDSGRMLWHSLESSKIKPDWMAVDLGRLHAIKHVLFLARDSHHASRVKSVTSWVGNKSPVSGTTLVTSDFTQCGEYPYQQANYFLSGISCKEPIQGQYVALVNFKNPDPMHFVEVGVFGFNLQ